MNCLKAGFARADITPPMGVPLRGYLQKRYADGVLDPLEINVMTLSCGEDTVFLISMDNCGTDTKTMEWLRRRIAARCSVPADAVFLSCTHTHTGPFLFKPEGKWSSGAAEERPKKRLASAEEAPEKRPAPAEGTPEKRPAPEEDPLVWEYTEFVAKRLEDAATFAAEDLKEARCGFGTGCAPNVAFIRRYLMKNGEIRTNPGVNNPEIDRPMGEADESVGVLRFDREGADTILLVHFGNHPDVVGGCRISADWPGFLRRRVEKALDGVRCVVFNGAQGDVNHVNVFPKGGDLNDMFMDFDDVSRGYGHARHIGNVVAGAVLQIFDKVEYRETDSLRYCVRTVRVPSNRPAPEDLPAARALAKLHEEGRDREIPYQGMMLTTVVAEAQRMIRLENGPDYFEMPVSAVAVGDIALCGLPGEPFTGIGRGLKENKSWAAVLPCCLTNGGEGYFPMMDAYEEGGYEARSSRFKAGVAEVLIREGNQLLDDLHTM